MLDVIVLINVLIVILDKIICKGEILWFYVSK